jgi:hypothetical protein
MQLSGQMDGSTSRKCHGHSGKGTHFFAKRQPCIGTFHLPHFQITSMVEPKEGKWDPKVY